MFDTTKEDLKEILAWASSGRLQLPDFQRDYVWGDADVRSLLASIAKGFPVGALLTLETGGELRFKPRPIAGVSVSDVEPEQLLLDGQQRITSLYQAMMSTSPVRTRTVKGVDVERYYYLDIRKAVFASANLEDAIVGVPADRVVRTNFGRVVELDLSTRQAEYEKEMFPLNLVFDNKEWFYGWRDQQRRRHRDEYEIAKEFDVKIIERIQRYKMPIIRLEKKNSREAICLVFEKVNVGGKKLDAFELVTAVYAAENFDLRRDWKGADDGSLQGRRTRILGHPLRQHALRELANTDFLQACTLLHTCDLRRAKAAEAVVGKELPQVSCRRDALLALPLAAYRRYADTVEAGFVEAGKFLNEQKIIWHRDVPYPPQTVALAAVFAILDRAGRTASARDKLTKWFWSGVLGELYGSAGESRLARDVPELIEWISGNGPKPRTIDEALFQVDRLRTLRSRVSAAYKGIHALLMRQGCSDFISGRGVDLMTFHNDRIDIHHVFPEAWCKKKGISPTIYDSIVNKTALSRGSNIAIGGDAPSLYLRRIEQKHKLAPSQVDDILRSHLIEPSHLRTDDFEAFFKARLEALSGLIGEAMGKPVVEDRGVNEPEIDVPEADAFDTDDELNVETSAAA